MARLSCGVCFAPDPPPSRWVDLTKLAEAQGFEYAWLFDSHVLWQEVYPLFALRGANSKTTKTCPRSPGPRRNRQPARHPERDLRRPDGDGHRPWRQLSPGARPEAGHGRANGGRLSTHP